MGFVKQEKPITVRHEKLGEVSVDVEVFEGATIDEFIARLNGEQNTIDFLNMAYRLFTKNAVRPVAQKYEVPDGVVITDEVKAKYVDEIRTLALDAGRSYIPDVASEKAPSQKKLAQGAKQLSALIASGKQSFSAEEIAALLAG